MLNNNMLGLIANILQVANYFENAQQTSNDEIMKALEMQNKVYLETVIKQNLEILERLERIKNAQQNSKNQNG